jgi:hypothetical protein
MIIVKAEEENFLQEDSISCKADKGERGSQSQAALRL